MKYYKIILFLLTLIFVSCGSSDIRFSEPQPSKVKVLKEFPSNMQASFDVLSDSNFVGYFDLEYPYNVNTGMELNLKNIIQITDNAIYNKLDGSIVLDYKLIKDSVMQAQYPNQTIIDSLVNEYYKRVDYEYKLITSKDSVHTFNLNLTDTMFYNSDKNIAKKYKYKTYINIQDDNNSWALYQILFEDKSLLSFCSLSDDDEAVLRRILKNNNEESEADIVSPSKKSFKKFIKVGGFENKIELKKQ